MANKKSFHTYDLDSVYNAYMINISEENQKARENAENELKKLNEDLTIAKEDFAQLKKDIADMRNNKPKLDSRESTDKEIGMANKKYHLGQIYTMPENMRSRAESQLTVAETKMQIASQLKVLESTNTTNFTATELKKHNSEIKKLKSILNGSEKDLEWFAKEIAIDNAKIDDRKKTRAEFLKLRDEVDQLALKERDKYSKEYMSYEDERKEKHNNATELLQYIKETEAEIKTKEAEYALIPEEAIPSIESFATFLKANGLSTTHAEELYKIYNNQGKFEKINYNDLSMRKMHPRRDFVLKKVVLPAAITSTGIGATIGLIAGSGLVGGSEILGIIPVSGTPGLTEMATTTVGAVTGLVTTPLYLKGKSLVTKTYYKLKAKSSVKNLDDFTHDTSLENLKMSQLIEEIRHTKHTILESAGPKKLILNIINRNRIHEVEAYAKELFQKYVEIDADKSIDNKSKAEKLKPIYELLSNVQDFITDDVTESKVHAMLTCKSTEKDTHPTYMFENVDIYATLKIYLDRLAKIASSDKKVLLKEAKTTSKNLPQKKEEACKIINGTNEITDLLNFNTKYSKYVPDDSKIVTVESSEVNGDEVVLNLVNGKKVVLKTNEAGASEVVGIKTTPSKITLKYADGTTKTIAKTKKTLSEIYIARDKLARCLASDPEFVAKFSNYKKQTIEKLINELRVWLSNDEEKFSITGNAKKLYNEAIEMIKTEQKSASSNI